MTVKKEWLIVILVRHLRLVFSYSQISHVWYARVLIHYNKQYIYVGCSKEILGLNPQAFLCTDCLFYQHVSCGCSRFLTQSKTCYKIVVTTTALSYSLSVLCLFPDKTAYIVFGPQCRPEAWGVCGCNRQPICPPEHRHHRHCQHRSERWQRAGSQGLWHGLRPDRCYYQCEITARQTTCQISVKIVKQ